ncbi:glycosyl hydrolase family 5 [Opitutaceae bacterium TAV4]|nr:glycosyl hydrolase family 5 [Opitutaceae bacterium TAV4]RRK01924.1 glycosyl hydrolase family 5 [Opitutaceae bacterium TAV3]
MPLSPVTSVLRCLSQALALAASVSFVVATTPTPDIITAGIDWAAYDHQLDIKAGSVFDFSFLADAPAGKHGRIVATPVGHLEFEDRPGQRIRLWGVNLALDANFPTKEHADILAERLARSGYNTVRFHYYDRLLTKRGGPSCEPVPELLDRLDYLFDACKRRGLYVATDVYASINFTLAEIPDIGVEVGRRNFKFLLPVSDTAFEMWKAYAKRLLARRNPYTGLTWGEDPALALICPVNEDTLFNNWTPYEKRPPEVVAVYEKAFTRWLETRKETVRKDDVVAFNEFLLETQIKADRRMHDYLREIGVKALLSGANFCDPQGVAYVRDHYDAVENHQYWAHPRMQNWSFPVRTTQKSVLENMGLPRVIMPSRVFGKPYFVTEFNYVWPNSKRGEGGVIMPAYASLQDWDALYNYEYAGDVVSAVTPSVVKKAGALFAIGTDPIGLLSDRVSALIFRRGDIQPAPGAVSFLTRRESALEGKKASPRMFPGEFSWLGLVTRIGVVTDESGTAEDVARSNRITAFVRERNTVTSRQAYPADGDLGKTLVQAGVIPPDSINAQRSRWVSETGQIEIDTGNAGTGNTATAEPRSAAYAKVMTPVSECFVAQPGQYLNGRRVTIENGESFASIYVVSVDGLPIQESARILVLHLTDSLNTGTRFTDAGRTVMEDLGTAPHLVKRGSTTINLALSPSPAGRVRNVWAVDATGKRIRKIQTTGVASDVFSFVAQTIPEQRATTLAYEIAQTPSPE